MARLDAKKLGYTGCREKRAGDPASDVVCSARASGWLAAEFGVADVEVVFRGKAKSKVDEVRLELEMRPSLVVERLEKRFGPARRAGKRSYGWAKDSSAFLLFVNGYQGGLSATVSLVYDPDYPKRVNAAVEQQTKQLERMKNF